MPGVAYGQTGYGLVTLLELEDSEDFEYRFDYLYAFCHHKAPKEVVLSWALENGFDYSIKLIDFMREHMKDKKAGPFKDFMCELNKPFIRFGLHL